MIWESSLILGGTIAAILLVEVEKRLIWEELEKENCKEFWNHKIKSLRSQEKTAQGT